MSALYHEIIHYTGHVQGVGFRYAARQVAKEFEVAGYVVNLPDGRVELAAQGRSSEVKAFIEAVNQAMHGYVKKVERTVVVEADRLSDFVIR